MVDPVLVGGAVTVAAVAIAAGYSYFTGNDSGVDVDDDGNDEVTFEGNNDAMFDCNDPTEDPAYRDDEFAPTGTGEADDAEDEDATSFQAAPEAVQDIGTDLAEVTGIGETRADDLQKAGFHTASDLYFAADEDLTDVSGIGDLTVSQVRGDIGSAEEGNDGESSEGAEEDSQDSEEQDSTSEQSSSSDEETDEADSEDDGSDSGETTDSTGNESDEE